MTEKSDEHRGIQRVGHRRFRIGISKRRAVCHHKDGRQPQGRAVDAAVGHPGDGRLAHALDGPARSDRRDELPDGRARAGWSPRRPRAGTVDAGRHCAVPGIRGRASGRGGPQPGPRVGAADNPRCASSARLRPRRAGRGKRDVRPPEPTTRRVGRRTGRGLPARPPGRERPPVAGQVEVSRPLTGLSQLLGAIALIGLGGLFAAIDAAISTVSLARVQELVRDERPGAGALFKVMSERPRYINLVVLLRIICEITATVLLVVFLYDNFGLTWALFGAATIMVLTSFVVIGVGPRTLGRQNAYSIALVTALPLQVISWLLMPISRLLVLVGNALTPGRGFRNGPFASEIELREVVDLAQQRGVVAADERRMIESVFELGDTPAREVMVPRTEMIWIESDKSADQATSVAVRSGHSRIPVIGENVDDIVGVVYLKDLVQQTYYSNNGGRDTSVAQIMRPAVFVPDSKPLDALLREMQRDRNHMSLLVDEYGAIAGLVTIEDVLEEIVGEIADEYDTDEVAPIEDLGDRHFRVSARLPIEDLGELYGVEFDEDLAVDTVGGLLAFELGRVPLPGAEVISHGLRLQAEGGTDHRGRVRIGTVLLSPAESDDSD